MCKHVLQFTLHDVLGNLPLHSPRAQQLGGPHSIVGESQDLHLLPPESSLSSLMSSGASSAFLSGNADAPHSSLSRGRCHDFSTTSDLVASLPCVLLFALKIKPSPRKIGRIPAYALQRVDRWCVVLLICLRIGTIKV